MKYTTRVVEDRETGYFPYAVIDTTTDTIIGQYSDQHIADHIAWSLNGRNEGPQSLAEFTEADEHLLTLEIQLTYEYHQ